MSPKDVCSVEWTRVLNNNENIAQIIVCFGTPDGATGAIQLIENEPNESALEALQDKYCQLLDLKRGEIDFLNLSQFTYPKRTVEQVLAESGE